MTSGGTVSPAVLIANEHVISPFLLSKIVLELDYPLFTITFGFEGLLHTVTMW